MDIKKISELFNNYDTDKNGSLNRAELEKASLSSVFSTDNVTFETFSNNDYIKGLSIEKQDDKDKKNVFTLNPLKSPDEFIRDLKKITNFEEIPTGSHKDVRDARACDISNTLLTQNQLVSLIIDKTTILSDSQKKQFQQAYENGKNPGLGIKKLHEQGVTGKGVKIAIIDQPLAEHNEFKNKIINYEEIGYENSPNWVEKGSMHGSSVTSIAVGDNVGVAPEADVVFFAAHNLTEDKNEIEKIKGELNAKIQNPETPDDDKEYFKEIIAEIEAEGYANVNKNYAEAINKVLDINEKLAPEERIPVISISWGFNSAMPDYNMIEEAIARAKKQGVFVLSTSMDKFYGKNFNGANRDPLKDPDDPKNYKAGAFWEDCTEQIPIERRQNMLLIPMDHRTVADYTDAESFRFEGNDGGMSWATPYFAGVYALAKQVNPSLMPEDFLQAAFDTSDECHNPDGIFAGRLINPEKLMEKIKP